MSIDSNVFSKNGALLAPSSATSMIKKSSGESPGEVVKLFKIKHTEQA